MLRCDRQICADFITFPTYNLYVLANIQERLDPSIKSTMTYIWY